MVTYPANPHTLPLCSITNASFENVEKVVKPPQRPTVRNNAQLLPSAPFLLNRPHRRPMRKQPTRFTASVAHGNPLLTPFIASDTRYLAAPPTKLPAPTTSIFLIKSETIELRFVLLRLCGCAARGTVWCRLAGASLSPGWTSAAALLTSRSKAREAPTEWTACRTLGRSVGELCHVPENV